MTEYWYTRLLIGSSLLLFFWLSASFFVDKFSYWTFLLVATTAMGFGHYFVGGFYQIRSFSRLPSPKKAYSWFGVLSIIATVITVWFLAMGQIGLFSFVSIGYFMVHGFYNEITLYERSTGAVANRWSIASIAFSLSGLIFLASGHVSSIFSPQLEYVLRNDYLLNMYLSDAALPVIGMWIGVGCFAIAIILQIIAVVRSSLKFAQAGLMGLIVAGAGVMVFFYPPSYIHIFSTLLLYHYIVWFLFYFRQFQQRSVVALRQYFLIHGVVFLPFLALFASGTAFTVVDIFIMNSYVFLVLTTIHITVSFMSEKAFKERFLL